MMNAYERRLAFTWLDNVASCLVRHPTQDTDDLVVWVDENQSALALDAANWPTPNYLQNLAKELRLGSSNMEGALLGPLKGILEAGRVAHKYVKPDCITRRLRDLGRTVGLSQTDIAILEIMLRPASHPLFDSLVSELMSSVGQRRRRDRYNSCDAFSTILGVSRHSIRKRFAADAPLVKSGLIVVEEDGDLVVISRLNRLANVDARRQGGGDVRSLLLDEAPPSELDWADFDHVAEARDHAEKLLRGALQSGEPGVNILLYGPPGTGKTEFCKVLANHLDANLYKVGEAEESGGEPSRCERLQELRFAQRLVGSVSGQRRRQSILLFDEMEDLLSNSNLGAMLHFLLQTPRRRGRTSGHGSKVYMNRLLEEAPTPTLWTTNEAQHTCPTILRRMMFAVELRQPSPKVRTRVWQRQLRKHGVEAGVEDARLLATEFDASPGVAAGATAAARLAGGDLDAVRIGVRSLARLMNNDKPVQKPPPGFDIALINADMDVAQLTERLAASGEHRFSLCLQGPPGSGKSAFVRHVGARLGLEMVLKRASDLLSMWVGETEKNIRQAFAEAKDAEAILVFDEADSLLGDRRFAQRSWEVSRVNEMLTWMESHPLPFACTTNFVERLDVATLRRFTFKIALDYLTADQAAHAFRGYFGIEPPDGLSRIAMLTPADFAVVRRRAEVLACVDDADALLRMLGEECAAKPGHKHTPGFG